MSNTAKVLIIDDEADLREIIAFDFESAGFDVKEAKDSNEALTLMLGEKMNAVVSDIRMPNGGGVELLKKVRESENLKETKMIFITGCADYSGEEAFHQGIDGFFTKPFDRRALVQTVQRLLLPESLRWKTAGQHKINAVVDFEISFTDLAEAETSGALHVGRGGIFLASQSPLFQNGDVVKFKIAFKNGSPPLVGEGIIRWIRKEATAQGPSGFGMEFLFLEPNALGQIIDLQMKKDDPAFIPKL